MTTMTSEAPASKAQRTKEEKIKDAIDSARKLDSLPKEIERLEFRLRDIQTTDVSVYKKGTNIKLDFGDEEISSLLSTVIRNRIAELNREIDAIVESLP